MIKKTANPDTNIRILIKTFGNDYEVVPSYNINVRQRKPVRKLKADLQLSVRDFSLPSK